MRNLFLSKFVSGYFKTKKKVPMATKARGEGKDFFCGFPNLYGSGIKGGGACHVTPPWASNVCIFFLYRCKIFDQFMSPPPWRNSVSACEPLSLVVWQCNVVGPYWTISINQSITRFPFSSTYKENQQLLFLGSLWLFLEIWNRIQALKLLYLDFF